MSITDIVASIDQRLSDLDTERTNLNGARAALINKPAPTAQTERDPTRRTRAKRPYEVVAAEKLIVVLAGSDAMSTKELAKQTNADRAQVLALLKAQEDAGQVRRTGTRAATRWQAVTDEDRIAARVAELEAGSRRSRARRN